MFWVFQSLSVHLIFHLMLVILLLFFFVFLFTFFLLTITDIVCVLCISELVRWSLYNDDHAKTIAKSVGHVFCCLEFLNFPNPHAHKCMHICTFKSVNVMQRPWNWNYNCFDNNAKISLQLCSYRHWFTMCHFWKRFRWIEYATLYTLGSVVLLLYRYIVALGWSHRSHSTLMKHIYMKNREKSCGIRCALHNFLADEAD